MKSYDVLNDVVPEMFHSRYDMSSSLMMLNWLQFFSLVILLMFDDDNVDVLHDEHVYDELIHLLNEIVLNILHTNSMHLLKLLLMMIEIDDELPITMD